MVVCPECGDKRCVHAADHDAPCAKVDIYAHNAWVERRHLLWSQPRTTMPAAGGKVYCCYAAYAEVGHDDNCPNRRPNGPNERAPAGC